MRPQKEDIAMTVLKLSLVSLLTVAALSALPGCIVETRPARAVFVVR
jgi:hypothetical protein